MAQRTYLIGLYFVLKAAHRYMTRYQTTIEANLTEPQLACFNAVLAAIVECLPLIVPAAPTP